MINWLRSPAGINAKRRNPSQQLQLAGSGPLNLQIACWSLGTAQFLEKAIERHEIHRPRSRPRKHGQLEPVNQPMSEEQFDGLFAKVMAFFLGGELFVGDLFRRRGPCPYSAHPRSDAGRLARAVRPPIVHPARPARHVPEFTLFVRTRLSCRSHRETVPAPRPASSLTSSGGWFSLPAPAREAR